jgi:hypothetical protein
MTNSKTRPKSVVVKSQTKGNITMKTRELPVINPDGKKWKKFQFSRADNKLMSSATTKKRISKALSMIKKKEPLDNLGLFTLMFKFGDGSYRQIKGYHSLDYLIENLPMYWETEHLNYDGLQEYYENAPIQDFSVIYNPTRKSRVGRGVLTSSCLWDAITQLGYKSTNKTITTDSHLKAYLNLHKNEGVSLDLIPKVEKIFKLNIDVYGDYCQPSLSKYTNRINLKLDNGHYSYEEKQLKSAQTSTYGNKIVVLYSKYEADDEEPIYLCLYYTQKGRTAFEVEPYEFFALLNRHKGKNHEHMQNMNDYKLCESFYHKKLGLTKQQTYKRLTQDYREYIKNAKIIEAEFKIDITKYGYSKEVQLTRYGKEISKYNAKELALEIFNIMRTKQITPEPISQIEHEYLQDATGGSLLYCKEKKLTVEHGYNYDFNSFYMELLTRQNFLIPARNPQFMSIERIDEITEKVYIIDCIIEGESKFFQKKKKYTSFDIYLAKLLKLTIKINKTDKANVMYYSKNDCIQSLNLLKPYVEKLYQLKTEHRGLFKQLLMLWGYLCEGNKIIKTFTHDNPLIVNSNIDIQHIKPNSAGFNITYYDRDRGYYKHDYARMKPFLLSYSRSDLFRQIQPHLDSVVSICVDGFVSNKRLDIKLGTQLGDLKLDKEGKCIIHCINNVEWI